MYNLNVSKNSCQWLRDTIHEGKDGETVRILMRCSPLKNMQASFSGVGMACVGGLDNFHFKMLKVTGTQEGQLFFLCILVEGQLFTHRASVRWLILVFFPCGVPGSLVAWCKRVSAVQAFVMVRRKVYIFVPVGCSVIYTYKMK